jgi:hypothetical protein
VAIDTTGASRVVFNFTLTRQSIISTPPASAVWCLNFNLTTTEKKIGFDTTGVSRVVPSISTYPTT